jgi:hypothetical protein
MQIDFGSITIKIAGNPRKIYFFAAALGFSHRQYIRAFVHERQSAMQKIINAEKSDRKSIKFVPEFF